MGEKKFTTISIPSQLADKVKVRIKGTGFYSVSSYVTYVLRQVLSSMEVDEKKSFSKKDEETVKERLRALGYLD